MSREMRHSGIEWIGEIPKEWKVSSVRWIMANKSIRNQPNSEVLSLYRDWGIVPKSSRDDNHNVTSEDTSNYKVVQKGDFVINKMKAWQGSMAVSEYDGIISPAYYVCSFIDENICKRYIHHLLRNESYKTEYMRLSSGLRVGQWDLNIENFLRIPIVLPPLSEQQKIANYLDKVCGEVDEMIALQEQMIEELKAYEQSVIIEAVTKSLNPDVPMKHSGIDWIGEVPEGWKVIKIKHLLNERKERSIAGLEEPLSMSQKFGLIPTKEMDSIPNIASSFVGAKLVYQHDLVFNKLKAHLGVFAESDYDGLVSPDYAVYYSSGLVEVKYLEYLFKSPQYIGEFIKLSTGVGAGLTRLYTSDLYSIDGIVPPIEIQKEIVDYIRQLSSEIDALIAIKQAKIDELKNYKKSVIYEYVTGKKEVV